MWLCLMTRDCLTKEVKHLQKDSVPFKVYAPLRPHLCKASSMPRRNSFLRNYPFSLSLLISFLFFLLSSLLFLLHHISLPLACLCLSFSVSLVLFFPPSISSPLLLLSFPLSSFPPSIIFFFVRLSLSPPRSIFGNLP